MAITGVNNYNNIYENTYASSRKEVTKKEELAAQKSTEATEKSSKSKSTTEYADKLAKLVPSAELQIGNSYSTAKTGITLTVHPKLLEKMQNDPETEKEMKELIKGVEAKNKLAEKWDKMTGNMTVFCHDFIDANGKFCSFAQTRREDKLNKKLREEAQKNAENRIEKAREKARENAEKITEKLEEKETDGTIYLDNEDMKKIMEAIRAQEEGQTAEKQRDNANEVGANLDLKI